MHSTRALTIANLGKWATGVICNIFKPASGHLPLEKCYNILFFNENKFIYSTN